MVIKDNLKDKEKTRTKQPKVGMAPRTTEAGVIVFLLRYQRPIKLLCSKRRVAFSFVSNTLCFLPFFLLSEGTCDLIRF